MRVFLTLSLLAFTISGCVSSTTSTVATTEPKPGYMSRKAAYKEARRLNIELKEAALKDAKEVKVGDQTFRVAINRKGSYQALARDNTLKEFVVRKNDTPYALVTPVGPSPTSYTGRDVEAAAQIASGCRAEFQSGVLAFLGGFSGASTDLGALEGNNASKRKDWRADLSC